MDIGILSQILELFQNYPYVIMFILMFFEGPVATYLGAFAASLGYANIWIVIILSMLGNQIPDSILYFFGRALNTNAIKRVMIFFGVSHKRIKWMNKNAKKHPKKIVTIVKLINPIAMPGLIFCGFINVPFKKFFITTLLLNIIHAIIFSFLGYYSGIAVNTFLKYLKIGEYLIIPIIVILTAILYFLLKKESKIITKKFNRE